MTLRSHSRLEIDSGRVKIGHLKSLILCASLAAVSTALFCGCGPGSPKVSSADLKAFDSASPELRERWTQAQAAARTNDYVQAILALRSLMPLNLSAEQRRAVDNAMGACDAKMMKAVEHGDPAAQKALETLRLPGTQFGR